MRSLPRRQDRLVQKQLLERQAFSRLLHILWALGKMHSLDSIGGTRQLPTHPKLSRQRLKHIPNPRQRLFNPLPNALRFQRFRRRMNRRKP
jgi:hypothetical protein